MHETELLSDKRCPVCKKSFTVLWPHQWAYKRGRAKTVYFCSWKCLRADEKEGEKKMGAPRIISDEQEKEAVRIALEGGDPLRYLEECGSNIPPQTWYRIKQKLKDADPETYEKLPKRIQRKDTAKKQVETPEGEYSAAEAMEGMKNAADEFFGKCKDMGLRIETPESPKICKPVNYEGFEFGVAKSLETGFRYEWSPEYKLFSIKAKGDELTLYIDDMRKVMEEAPKAARLMGVEL